MATTDFYYALTIVANGAGTTAYYSVTPDPGLAFAQGGVTIVPAATGATMVNIYPQTLQINAPAGSVSGAVTIITGASKISGRLMVSPPVDVAVVVTLYGTGGKQLGQAILDPETSSLVFSWPVDAKQALSQHDATKLVESLVPKAK
jgi:hypothetical protein